MKKLLFITLICVILSPLTAYAQSGIFQSYVIVDSGLGNEFFDLNFDTVNSDFDTFDFGSFNSTDTLILNGAENKTYKCNADNILNGWLNYRIYLTSASAPVFSSTQIFWTSDDGTVLFCAGTSFDQTWQSVGANINVLNGLPAGDYYLEVYTHADFSVGGVQNGFPHTINNGTANYKARFTLDNPPTAVCTDYTAQ